MVTPRYLFLVLAAVALVVGLFRGPVPDPHERPVGAWVSAAHAEDPDHPDDASCSHCHDSPHPSEREEDCGACHNPVSWSPSTFSAQAHDAIFALKGRHQVVDCADCHANAKLTGIPQECAGCHVDRHRGLLGGDCAECHSPLGFTPVPDFDHGERTGFALSGAHGKTMCRHCHEGDHGRALRNLGGERATCSTCHQPEHGDLGPDCGMCHDPETHASFDGKQARNAFDHRTTGFPLHRRHGALSCASCHPSDGNKPVARCQTCHTDPHSGQASVRCGDCHEPDRWRLVRFDHDLTTWPLRGRHFATPCADCHTNQRWLGLSRECWDCHALDATRAPQWVEAHRFGRSDCGDCHSQWSWQ